MISLAKERSLAGHSNRVFHLRWSPAEPLCLASVGEAEGCIWHNVGGDVRRVRFSGTELMRVCWSPDGARVLTGDGQGKIDVRAAADGEKMATLDASAEDEVYGLEMLSDEGLLAAGTGSCVQLWDLPTATRKAQVALATADGGVTFGGAARNPESKAYIFGLAARGRVLSAALSDGTIRLMDSQTLQVLATLTEHARRGAPAFGAAISPTSPLLASSDQEGTVLLWDMRSLGQGPLAETSSQHGAVHSVAFVPAGGVTGGGASELLVTGGDRSLSLHRTRTATLATAATASSFNPVLCVDAVPASPATRVASGGGAGSLISDATVSVWQVEWHHKRQREEEGDEKSNVAGSVRPSVSESTSSQSESTQSQMCLPCGE